MNSRLGFGVFLAPQHPVLQLERDPGPFNIALAQSVNRSKTRK
jgi:hypothetical protein